MWARIRRDEVGAVGQRMASAQQLIGLMKSLLRKWAREQAADPQQTFPR